MGKTGAGKRAAGTGAGAAGTITAFFQVGRGAAGADAATPDTTQKPAAAQKPADALGGHCSRPDDNVHPSGTAARARAASSALYSICMSVPGGAAGAPRVCAALSPIAPALFRQSWRSRCPARPRPRRSWWPLPTLSRSFLQTACCTRPPTGGPLAAAPRVS